MSVLLVICNAIKIFEKVTVLAIVMSLKSLD
jgi:hypothetical protein